MTTLHISPNGDLILQRDFLENLGFRIGQSVDVDALPNGEVRIRPTHNLPNNDDIEYLIGCYKGKISTPISLQEMNETIEQGWAKS